MNAAEPSAATRVRAVAEYDRVKRQLRKRPRVWLVTGVAGFIGSHLLQALLELEQRVIGLDNFATGHRINLDEVRQSVSKQQWARFKMIKGDIANRAVCQRAGKGADIVLHQAALGSVPHSIKEPLATNTANVTGFINMLDAARLNGVRRFVFASSSAVYGDHTALPKKEAAIGNSLSPYAISKRIDELYAEVFMRCYGLETVGLRYFNVFGPRQDPNGAYAAVIPRWISAMLDGKRVDIYGDGKTSRDFCYVANVVQANLLAGISTKQEALGGVYNIAVNGRTTLDELSAILRSQLADISPKAARLSPRYLAPRTGDVRHSQADLGRAWRLLGYEPTHSLGQGLAESMGWYQNYFKRKHS